MSTGMERSEAPQVAGIHSSQSSHPCWCREQAVIVKVERHLKPMHFYVAHLGSSRHVQFIYTCGPLTVLAGSLVCAHSKPSFTDHSFESSHMNESGHCLWSQLKILIRRMFIVITSWEVLRKGTLRWLFHVKAKSYPWKERKAVTYCLVQDQAEWGGGSQSPE